MRHQSVGEISCYLKLSRFRALSIGMKLGVASYLANIKATEFCARWQDLNVYMQGAPPLQNTG